MQFLSFFKYSSFKFSIKLEHKNTIILDKHIASFYRNYFIKDKVFLLDTRFFSSENLRYARELYFFFFLKSLLKKIFIRKFSLNQIYILEIIKKINPNNILTFNDYDVFFLSMKKIFPKKKLIVVCHTFRSAETLIQLKKKFKQKKFKQKKFYADLVCIWGKKNIKFYNQFMKTKYLISGSLKNNCYEINKKKLNNSIVFISQFRRNGFIQEHGDFLKILLNNAHAYLEKRNLKLIILSNLTSSEFPEEYDWYKKILGTKKFIFIKKKNILDSYNNSKNYNNFFTFSSSLGFELAARSKKVFFFFPKFTKEFIKKNKQYPSPYTLSSKNLIWSDSITSKSIEKIFNLIFKISDKKYSFIKKKFISPYVNYDYNSIITKKKLQEMDICIFK